MSNLRVLAPPTSRRRLRTQAQALRRICGREHSPYLPITELVEQDLLGLLRTGFDWDVVEEDAMPREHGLTLLNEKLMLIREDVHEGSINGNGRDRLTVAHEVAHVLLHSQVSLARPAPNQRLPRYHCPEWQANCFAGELLIDYRQISPEMTLGAVAQEFGVSVDAARFNLERFRQEGLL